MIDFVSLGYSSFPFLLILLVLGDIFQNKYILTFGLVLSIIISLLALHYTTTTDLYQNIINYTKPLSPLNAVFFVSVDFILAFSVFLFSLHKKQRLAKKELKI